MIFGNKTQSNEGEIRFGGGGGKRELLQRSYSFLYPLCCLITHEFYRLCRRKGKIYFLGLFLLCRAYSVANSIIKRLKLLRNEILPVDFSSLTVIIKKTTYKIKLFVFTVWSTNAIDFSIKTPNCRNTRTFNIGVCLWERL